MVESSESWLLIGREDSPKMFKGGTLTILNLCQWITFETFLSTDSQVVVKWQSSGSQVGSVQLERVQVVFKNVGTAQRGV